jgi:hypothetical protein
MANWRKTTSSTPANFVQSSLKSRHADTHLQQCWNVEMWQRWRCCRWHLFSLDVFPSPISVSVCVCVCGCVPSIVPFVCLVFVSVCFSYFSPMKFVRCWGRKTDNNEKHGVVMDETPLLWTLFDGCHLLREAAFIVVLHLMPFSPGWHIVDNGPPSSAS